MEIFKLLEMYIIKTGKRGNNNYFPMCFNFFSVAVIILLGLLGY